MEIFPAIDLKDGKVVRLTQGDYNCVDVYSENPVDIALSFAKKGAKNLHVVDLDGARDGKLSNFTTIKDIAEKAKMFIEVGGGIRDEERVNRYLEIGVGRVILGTVAATDFAFLERMVAAYGEKIAVGVDAKDEKIAVNGWTKVTGLDSVKFCKKLENAGVKTIIYTDISKDGAMQGTNMEIYKRLQSGVACNFIASGGISSLKEIRELLQLGVYGAIVGKAIYQGALKLEEVLSICRQNG
ncbi:MAG: 1-(5-phosphoribosyl)-5-[(5-phosphoribosylamino)methylideneamino]imidazole-4-carboxamide isomerase [Oscillospiraceae bacterium]|nr:1-(5-phosphoribosyl)-5-[(5-phosphoribosylamino)methylideneamino]imidazole-4-carboxamide isomerase [Oscillospiraceae bacterium]